MKRPHISNIVADLSTEQRAELGALEPLLTQLAAADAPQPSPDETARLIAQLRPLVTARAATERPAPEAHGLHAWVRLAWAQTTLVGASFWWACAVVLAVAVITMLLGQSSLLTVLFAALSPALAAVAVAYLMHPTARTLVELERISPVHPLELLYARLALVLSCNLVLAGIIFGMVWLDQPQFILWRLIVVWLGPLLGLVGVALYAAVRWGNVAGVSVPLGVWGTLIALGWYAAGEHLSSITMRTVDAVLILLATSNSVLVSALVAALIGIGLLFHSSKSLATQGSRAWT